MSDLTDLVSDGVRGTHSWLKRSPKKMRGKKDIDDKTLPRRFSVLELRIKGFTFQEIAEKLTAQERTPISAGACYGWYQWAMTEFFEEPTLEARTLDLARLDKLLKAWMPLAAPDDDSEAPDAKATDLVLKIMKQRQELLHSGAIDNDSGVDEAMELADYLASVLDIPIDQLLATADARVQAEFWMGNNPPLMLHSPSSDSEESGDEEEDPTIG